MKKEKEIRFNVRFSDELGNYIQKTALKRGVGSHELIRSVLGEYKEREEKQQEVIV